MLNNLHIKNFRILEDLEISKLGRVNLIVGKNNSGKSTVLEALRVVAGKAHPTLLREILQGHDENFSIDDDLSIQNPGANWSGLKHLFTNRMLPKGNDIYISIASDGGQLLKIEHVFYYIKEEFEENEDGEPVNLVRRRVIISPSEFNELEQTTESSTEFSDYTPALRITSDSGRSALLDLDDNVRRVNYSMAWRGMEDANSINHSYVSTEFITAETLSLLWDKVAISPYETIVLEALQIVDKNVERLAFVEDVDSPSVREKKRIAIVKLRESDQRIPLNSMGDGMSRILQLILSVFPAKNGVLLIDEFENGLHFSVQEEVWRMLFKLAFELDIQVFATTHSWDCIESFAKVAGTEQETGILLKMSRSRLTSDHGKIIATVYDEAALQTITASELEVR
jgi:AAA15 family ATPase/GTPase